MSTVDVQLSFSRTRNIVGGATGSIPYQTANSSTVFIPIGGNGTILQSNGSTATWVALGGLTAGVASQITTIQRTTNASHFLTFVDSDNSSATAETVYTTSSFVINPSTGNVGIGASSPAVKLDVKQAGSNWYDGLRVVRSTNDNQRIVFGNTSGASWIASVDAAGGNNNQLIFGRSTDGTTFTESARFASGGDLGIGTNGEPSFTLGTGVEIQRTGTATLRLDSNTFATELRGLVDGTQIYQLSAGYLDFGTSNTTRMRVFSNGNIAINTTTDSSFKLEVNGSFAATTKSFVISHPTKPGMKLRYGSLEGPENGIYVRGNLSGSNVIELPDYWKKLVDPDSITVNLTPIGRHQNLYVETIADNKVVVGNSNLLNKDINCFYIVFAERRDVDKLQVEIY